MSKFKVGDKVVRKVDNPVFYRTVGRKDFYIVTDIGWDGKWLQVDGLHSADPRPWDASNFILYVEQDDPLPLVPDSVMYYNSTTSEDNFQHMLVQPHWELEGHLTIAIVKSGKKFDQSAYGDVLSLNLEPDAALQLAHDLNRMANEIKRKQKSKA